jgi:hypothetical protein
VSKFSKILVALAAATALATPAFAVTADVTGSLQIRGFAWDNSVDFNDDIDDNGRGVDQRFRLFTNAALNENVKVVFGVEVDNVWGDTGATEVDTAADVVAGEPVPTKSKKEVGTVGTDAKSEIEIKHLYLDFNIPALQTNVKAGSQYFKLGGGFIIADDAAGLQARFTPAKEMSFLFAWVKPQENSASSDEFDSDYYHLQYDGTFGDWKISPYVGYYDVNDTILNGDPAEDGKAYFLGFDVAGKIGPVALAATVVGNDWEQNDDVDGRGLAAMVKGAYVLQALTLSAEAAYYGDDDTDDGQFVSLRQDSATGLYNNFSEIVTGGRFDVRSSLNSVQGGANKPYIGNFMYGKLGAEFKATDNDKISAFYIYSQAAEDGTTVADNDITFGHELDAYYDRAIVPGLTFSVGGGYLLADSDVEAIAGESDDAWKVGTALTYTF